MTSRLNHFTRNNTAAAAPEHAIVVAVVLIAVLSVGTVIGDFANGLNLSSLGSTSGEMSSEQSGVEETNSTLPSPPDANSARTIPVSLGIFVVIQSILVLAVVALLKRKKQRKRRDKREASNEQIFREYATALLLALRHEHEAGNSTEPSVRQFMNTKFGSVLENARSADVEKQLLSSPHEALVVLDKNKSIQGLITPNDLDTSKSTAQKMMRELPLRFEVSDTMSTAMLKMSESNSGFAAVVADGRIAGVISNPEISLALRATLQVLKESHAQHREALLRTLSTS